MIARQRAIMTDILRANYPEMLSGNKDAAMVILKALDSERKMFGLDAPQRVLAAVNPVDFANEAGRLISRIQEIDPNALKELTRVGHQPSPIEPVQPAEPLDVETVEPGPVADDGDPSPGPDARPTTQAPGQPDIGFAAPPAPGSGSVRPAGELRSDRHPDIGGLSFRGDSGTEVQPDGGTDPDDLDGWSNIGD
jgi:hypothetical protein